MAHRVKGESSALRGTVIRQWCIVPDRMLLVGLIAAGTYAPLSAQAADAIAAHVRRSSGVVMMMGGMASNGDPVTQPARASSESLDALTDTSRQSVVIQPGGSTLNDAVRQPSASVTSRVMALSRIVNEAAHMADVDSALLMAVIDVESGGNPQAVSPKGATGLMQLMPGTAARHGTSDLFDPRQNIEAGARYLKELMRQFGGLPLALAAYNAGEGAVQKYGGQIPPYAETMNYVPKVIARYKWYQDALSSAGAASVQAVSNGGVHGRFMLIGSGGVN